MTTSSADSAFLHQRSDLVTSLRGHKIEVPDILAIYQGWTVRKHPDTNELREDLECFYKTYIPTDEQRNKARKVDSALFAGTFWTAVAKDKFEVLCNLMAWFFFWDDEIDCGSLTNDRERTEAYINDTIAFLKCCLQPELNTSFPIPGRLHNTGPFIGIGKAMLVGQSLEDRNRFAESLYAYFEAVRASQAQRLVGVQALDAYIERRVESIASRPCLAILPWAYSLTIPSWIWDHEATKRLIREVAFGVFLANDIASVKKELENDDVDSIIPILVYEKGVSAQQAADIVIKMMTQSYQDFLAAGDCLRQAVSREGQSVMQDMNIFIDSCLDVIVGNALSSMIAPRYLARTAFSGMGYKFTIVL
ncbi:terpenoid synthase [Ophiobolus disseminans]|uniref:Terpene synthase n=1 Tax=Ophiobolus disseminans TaxID=1469910 RepID=A0A6A7A4P5_9PLEO|nr:terpenoid synthase [Ophiobolus disseminans]